MKGYLIFLTLYSENCISVFYIRLLHLLAIYFYWLPSAYCSLIAEHISCKEPSFNFSEQRRYLKLLGAMSLGTSLSICSILPFKVTNSFLSSWSTAVRLLKNLGVKFLSLSARIDWSDYYLDYWMFTLARSSVWLLKKWWRLPWVGLSQNSLLPIWVVS